MLFWAVALLLNHPLLAGGPSPRPAKPYAIGQFMKTIRFGGADLSPDEKTVLFSSNQDGKCLDKINQL